MRSAGSVVSLIIKANTSPCAHICRYCMLGDRGSKFPLERWMDFVSRFKGWQEDAGPRELNVQGGCNGPSYNFDLDSFATLNRWNEKLYGKKIKTLPLGGLKMRSESNMRRWLEERFSLGVRNVHASFVGCGSLHDRWNGRQGDFEFLIRTFRSAIEIGMGYAITSYITKSSIAFLTPLAAVISKLPSTPVNSHYRLFYYQGHGAHHEAERVTEDDLCRIPKPAFVKLRQDFPELHSEAEWIEFVQSQEEMPHPLHLTLELTEHNIDELEHLSCKEIFDRLESRARADFRNLPSDRQLSQTVADPLSKRIYSIYEVRRLWLDRFIAEYRRDTDRTLLQQLIGKSANPPVLRDFDEEMIFS